MKKSATITVEIKFTDQNGPLNITGATVHFVIKETVFGAELVNKECVITDGATGIATATITAEEAAAFPANKTLYSEAKATLENGAIVRTKTENIIFDQNIIQS